MDSKRLLVLVRHAKAEAFAPSDVDRVLSERGRADARALGAWLRDQEVVPDEAFVSSAARTRETWELLAGAAGWTVEPRVEGALYQTDEDGLVELVRDASPESRTVVVVGHNPTVGMAVQLLDDGDGASDAVNRLGGFPTGTAAVFEVPGEWAELAPMSAHLAALHVGRG